MQIRSGLAKIRIRWEVVALLLLAPAALAATMQVRLDSWDFEWTTVDDQDRAHFHWTATLINDVAREFEVKVTVDLLDDDDTVVHSDSTTIRLQANVTRTVEHAGSFEYDRAADVVSFQFRLDSSPPEGL